MGRRCICCKQCYKKIIVIAIYDESNPVYCVDWGFYNSDREDWNFLIDENKGCGNNIIAGLMVPSLNGCIKKPNSPLPYDTDNDEWLVQRYNEFRFPRVTKDEIVSFFNSLVNRANDEDFVPELLVFVLDNSGSITINSYQEELDAAKNEIKQVYNKIVILDDVSSAEERWIRDSKSAVENRLCGCNCKCDTLLSNGGLVVNLEYNSTGIPHTSPEELLFLFNPAGLSTTKLNPCNLNLSSDHVLCSDIYSPPISLYGCDDQFYDNWTFLESKISSEAISPNNFSPPETRYRECHYRGLALYQGFSTPPQYLERDAYLYKNFAPFFANCDIYYFFIYRFFIKLNKIENIINIRNIYRIDNSFEANIFQTKNFYHTYGILTYSASYVKNYRWKLVESIGFGGQYTGYYLPETPLESTWRISIGSNPSTQFPYDYNGLFSCSQCMGTDLNSSYSEAQVLNSGQRTSIYPYQIDRILHKSASQIKNYQFFQNCQCENLLEIMQLDLVNTDYTNYLFEWPQGGFSNNINIESPVLNTFDLNNIKIKYITKNPNDLF